VKAFVRTWRFNQDTVVGFHGAWVSYDTAAHILIIGRPVLENRIGDVTAFTITAGDEFTVETCVDCKDHPREPDEPALHGDPLTKFL
jgi:hypothetical protein